MFHKSAAQSVLLGFGLSISAIVSFVSALRFKISVFVNLLKMFMDVFMSLILIVFVVLNDFVIAFTRFDKTKIGGLLGTMQ